jgi:hypothetical protein
MKNYLTAKDKSEIWRQVDLENSAKHLALLAGSVKMQRRLYIMTVYTSILAIVIAAFSLWFTNKSYKKMSENSVFEYRPYVIGSNPSYARIIVSKLGNSLVYTDTIPVEFSNIGKTPALKFNSKTFFQRTRSFDIETEKAICASFAAPNVTYSLFGKCTSIIEPHFSLIQRGDFAILQSPGSRDDKFKINNPRYCPIFMICFYQYSDLDYKNTYKGHLTICCIFNFVDTTCNSSILENILD